VRTSGPANNSFQASAATPAVKGWDACTGLGSVNREAVPQEHSAAELAEV
jgi:hypothetical protein